MTKNQRNIRKRKSNAIDCSKAHYSERLIGWRAQYASGRPRIKITHSGSGKEGQEGNEARKGRDLDEKWVRLDYGLSLACKDLGTNAIFVGLLFRFF
jgi:hypothetical protein